MHKLLSFIIISLSLSSCFKTAEDIRRDKLVDQQIQNSSKIVADLTSEVNSLKSRIAQTSGQIEEYNYKTQESSKEQSQNFEQNMTQLQEQVKILTEQNLDLRKDLLQVQAELKTQKNYIRKVTGSLSKIAGPTKSSSKSKLKRAHINFEKGKNITAKKLYLEVLSEGKINAAQKNSVYYNLGLLDYKDKKYSDALVYFSKIYTKYPKSSYAPRSLLYIARSFKKMNKKAEANASFAELIQKYPKSKQAKNAKKETIK